MKVYLVLDEYGYGIILKGIYTNVNDAIKVQYALGKAYITKAQKAIKEANESYERRAEYIISTGRKPHKRTNWLSWTPREYVNEFIIKIKVFEVDAPLNHTMYME
jgi:hypothetical protein